MAEVPAIDIGAAEASGRRLVRPGPPVSRAQAAAVVAGIRRALAASLAPAVETTELDVTPIGREAVVDRATWVTTNVAWANGMLGRGAADAPDQPLSQRVRARLNGVQLGGVLAAVSGRVLGQYLPAGDDSRLVLIAPNVADVEAKLDLVPADFRLWVCLHERTHQLQFARAPWLEGYLAGALRDLLDGDSAGWRPQRGAGLVGAFLSAEQRVVFERVSAVMALLEGYADVMMDRAGVSVVPTLPTIRARFSARRAKGGWTAVLNKVLGLDLKLAQYREGADFCRRVIDRVGVSGLNAVYESAELLPRPGEITEATRWLARVHG